jgi:GMP synthase-like glutamine amidotransferase
VVDCAIDMLGSCRRGAILAAVRVLFVKQDHASPSGLVGDAFASLGWDEFELTVVPEARFLSPDVPAYFPSPDLFDAIVLYGAPWSVYDTATIGSWVGDEIAFARSAISLGVPLLGICFGGQLLAAALGGSVAAAPTPEIGWIPVSDDPSGLIEPGPWFSWHFDRFTVPSTAAVLSRTAAADQAFCAGRSLGLQFHPEVNEEVLDSWLRVGGYDQLSGLDIDAEALLEQTRQLAGAAAARTTELVRRFVTDVARRPTAPLPDMMPTPTAQPQPPATAPGAGDATVLTPAR